MAQSLDNARTKIKTSVHGRRLGIDHDENLVGVKAIRKVVTAATSATTGTVLPNHGFVTITSSNARSFILTDPIPGVEVSFAMLSSGTADVTILPQSATFMSSQNSAGTNLILGNAGRGATLMGLSTALWALSGSHGTSVGVRITT